MKQGWLKILDLCSEYSLYGLILFIPISTAAVETFFGFCLLFFMIKKAINPDFKIFKSYTHLFLLLFIIFSAASLFNSGPYIIKSLKALFFKWAEYVLIFLIAQDTLANFKRRRHICIYILLGMACILVIDSFSQHFLGIEFIRQRGMFRPGGYSRLFSVTASFQHYNDYASFLVVALSLSLALLIPKQKKIYNFGLYLLIGLTIASLLLTFSRGSWLAFVLSLVLMLFISRKVKKIFPILAAFIILIISLPGTKERVDFTFGVTGDADRFIVWRSAARMIKENPFLGKGLGTFMDYFHKYVPQLFVQYAHNCYLQIWAEAGIFSLLFFLIFLSLLLLGGIKTFKAKGDYIALGLVCGIFGFLVHSFFDTQFYSLQMSSFFWAAAGILQSITTEVK